MIDAFAPAAVDDSPDAAPDGEFTYAATPSGDVTFHWIWLAICSGIVVASAMLSVSEAKVCIPFTDSPLPAFCNVKRWFGVNCPGCGLTRSFVSLAHGRFSDALSYNPAGPFWFLLVAGQIPFRIAQLVRIRRGLPAWNLDHTGIVLVWIGSAMLVAQWLWRQSGG